MLRERLAPRAEMRRTEIGDGEKASPVVARAARAGSTSIEQFMHFLARPKSGRVLFRHQDIVPPNGGCAPSAPVAAWSRKLQTRGARPDRNGRARR